ncbi:DNA-3-methyladenine glycosylase family protein [Paenibacillus xanthanilyticus]|uniref:DNA-3-methyladenine glycosylase II n=1 Tax=Paenibacillus xanthanilyticus TaxID=1783531 RepID=A0ABV8K7D0_9BACL
MMRAVATKAFDYGEAELTHLMRVDPLLGEAIARIGRIERTIIPDPFAALAHAVVGQLISVKAADAIWLRMQQRVGEMTPGRVAELPIEALRECGVTMRKAEAIQGIACAALDGKLDLSGLNDRSDDEVIALLTALKGIGRWTAEMLLIGSLERPDVVSWGDIAIRRGMMTLYGQPDLTKAQFDEYRARYSPYGSVASIYLWAIASVPSTRSRNKEPEA